MNIGKTFYASNRKAWRAWLSKNHAKEKEIWLVYPKKHTEKKCILYNDAVEEALCFGWIDSIVKGIDSDTYAQRFSPRNPKSRYSQANVERLRALVAQGRVMKPVLATLSPVLGGKFEAPKDILAAIWADERARDNFEKFPEGYKRIRIAFIGGARKRPVEFRKRLGHFVEMTAKNRTFGFGGIGKHFGNFR